MCNRLLSVVARFRQLSPKHEEMPPWRILGLFGSRLNYPAEGNTLQLLSPQGMASAAEATAKSYSGEHNSTTKFASYIAIPHFGSR